MKKILFSLLLLYSSVGHGQDMFKVLVGFSPGAANYILATLTADSIEKQGLKSIVEMKPGASGLIAMNDCVLRNTEKNLLCIASQTQLVNSMLLSSDIRRFDPATLTYIRMVAATPLVLFTDKNNNKSSAEILKDLRDPNKKKTIGVSSLSIRHYTEEFTSKISAQNVDIIDYKGGAQVVQDLMGNHVDYMMAFWAGMNQRVDQGQVNVVFVLGETFKDLTLNKFPKIQTFVPGVNEDTQKWGFIRGPNLEAKQTEYLNQVLNKVLTDPLFLEKGKKEGFFFYNANISADDFQKLFDKEREEFIKQYKK
jgi:tripartite-type tricarboxylate transporter receptor subunit TctC